MSPHLPNLTVQQLKYLVAAADAPTRAAAASGLGVTPSALTQGLAELERRVGLPLFERWGRHTELRPQAAAVLAHARRVVAAMGDGTGAVMLDGKMEDDASLKQCLVMVELAEELAAIDPDLKKQYDAITLGDQPGEKA